MQHKCDAWREEVEKLSPLKDEVAQLHQEKARLQQEVKDKDLLLTERERINTFETMSELTPSVQSTMIDKETKSGIRLDSKQKSLKTRDSELVHQYDVIHESTDTLLLGSQWSKEVHFSLTVYVSIAL